MSARELRTEAAKYRAEARAMMDAINRALDEADASWFAERATYYLGRADDLERLADARMEVLS